LTPLRRYIDIHCHVRRKPRLHRLYAGAEHLEDVGFRQGPKRRTLAIFVQVVKKSVSFDLIGKLLFEIT